MEIVEEYDIADVAATEHVALKQLEAFANFEELYENELIPTLKLSLEMTNVLQIEYNAKINLIH